MAATDMEIRRVLESLEGREERPLAGRRLITGRRGTLEVATVVSGIGKSNAAMATATALQVLPRCRVLSVGVGGAFPGTALGPGEVAVANTEYYGDDGVDAAGGWEGLEATGVPLWESATGRWFNRLPVDPAGVVGLERAAAHVAGTATGPFVTVSTVTGTARRALDLEGHFGAVCENMEGAAVAHAALVAGCPFSEVRGISNRVGPRDRESWDLELAAGVAQQAALRWLDSLGEGDS